MKKILLVFMILACLEPLSATAQCESGTYYVGDWISISTRPDDYLSEYWVITAVLPYADGYVIKLNDNLHKRVLEYYVKKGSVLYGPPEDMWPQRNNIPAKGVITDIRPNSFTIEFEYSKK